MFSVLNDPRPSQALSVSLVILGALYLRRKYTIDPNTVYRLAMVRLNTHPGLLEVMGAPLVGSPVRATVLTGGKLRFKGLMPRIQSRRAQIIFPLRGSERKGLASLEAKKRKVCPCFRCGDIEAQGQAAPHCSHVEHAFHATGKGHPCYPSFGRHSQSSLPTRWIRRASTLFHSGHSLSSSLLPLDRASTCSS